MTSLCTRSAAVLILALFSGAFSSGCDPGHMTEEASLRLGEPLALVDTEWVLAAFVEDGERRGVGTTTIVLSFSEEEVSGASVSGGRTNNTYWGSYRATDGGGLDIFSQSGNPGVTSTRAGEPGGSRLDDYIFALREVTGYGFDGDVLVLTDGEQHLLRFAAR